MIPFTSYPTKKLVYINPRMIIAFQAVRIDGTNDFTTNILLANSQLQSVTQTVDQVWDMIDEEATRQRRPLDDTLDEILDEDEDHGVQADERY